MKKTQFIDLFKNIKKTKVSFIAITMFVALGVAIFTGFSWAGKAIVKSVFGEFDNSNTYDFEILYPYGLTDDNLEELKKLDCVTDIEGSYFTYQVFIRDGIKYQAKVISLTDRISTSTQIEGNLPSKMGEVAVEKLWANNNNVSVGDVITFVHDDDGTAHYIDGIINKDTDVLTASQVTPDGMKYLYTDTYTVTALVENATYLAAMPSAYGVSVENNTPVNCIMYIPECNFDEAAFGGYVDVLVRSDLLRGYDEFNDEYREKCENIQKQIESLLNDIVDDKNKLIVGNVDELLNDADSELNKAQSQLSDAKDKITQGEKELSEGRKLLDESRKKLENGQAEVDRGWVELNASKAMLEDGRKQLQEKEAELEEGRKKVEESQKRFDEIKPLYDQGMEIYETVREEYQKFKNDDEKFAYIKYVCEETAISKVLEFFEITFDDISDYIMENLEKGEEIIGGYVDRIKEKVDSAQQQLEEGWKQINDGERLLAEKKKEVEEGEARIATAQKQLEDAQREIDNGRIILEKNEIIYKEKSQELAQGKIDYEEGCKKYEEESAEFESIRKRAGDIKASDCVTSNLEKNISASSVVVITDVFDRLRYNMASLFVIFGLLVCYSAVSRIVSEQTSLIGTKKALGLYNSEITMSYLLYTGIAATIGSVLGVLISRFIIEPVMLESVKSSLLYERSVYHMNIIDAVLVIGLEMVLILLVSYVACRGVLKRNAIKLLNGPDVAAAKVHFYEKFKIWEKASLFTKTIINNCFNDKKRVFATVVGVAGCAALVCCAMTMRNSVMGSFNKQFDDIFSFDSVIFFDDENESGSKEIKKLLDEKNIEYSEICHTLGAIKLPEGNTGITFVMIPADDKFDKFVNFMPVGNTASGNEEGVWLSNSYAQYYGAGSGDKITYVSAAGKEYEMSIKSPFEYYLTRNQVIMSADYYEKCFGQKVVSNAIIADLSRIDKIELQRELADVPGFLCFDDYYENSYLAFATFGKVADIIVVVYIALAVIMAILVLLVLLNMFVDEKKKELIVLMINGYSLKDARRYIYSDTIFLTVIGIAAGIAVGYFIGIESVKSFESSITIFIKQFGWLACVLSVCITAVLTFVMTKIALGRIGKFRLTEINNK